MPLTDFTLFFYGILCELILLYEGANGSQSVRLGVEPPLISQPLLARTMSPGRMLMIALGAAAAALVGIFQLTGIGQMKVFIDTPVINLLFIGLGLFVFAAAFAVRLFLPPINEQAILAVQVLILLYAATGGMVDWIPLAALTVVPALVSLVLVIWRKPFPPLAKAALYLWYLLSLLAMPFQSGQMAYFRQSNLSWFESWTFGALFIFMIIHSMFAVRFFLIVSSMLLPRNRPAIAMLMPYLFSDEQVSLLSFGLVIGLTAALLFANQRLGLVAPPIALGLCVMLVTQILGRRG